jgi:tetratricopeptide (TPR) repeat protein
VNGVRASQAPDPNGGTHFVAYVAPTQGMTEVEVIVRGLAGAPVIQRFPVTLGTTLAANDAAGAAAVAPAPGFRGRRWAVVVGVSAYQDTAIRGLRYADADAQAFYDFLRSDRAGLGGFAEANVKLLLNDQATYREIRSALFTFLKGATEDDQVVIYFAGHGAPDPQRLSNLYLLTHDTELRDIAGSAFPMEDMTKAIRELYARDILVVTDACHSAGVGGQVATRDLGLNQINESFLQQLSASTGGLAIFTASGANQLSQEDERWGGGHGVFTHYLLEGLNGAADEDHDRIVSLVEMMEYTRGRVRAETQNAQIPTISQTAYDPYWPMSIVTDPNAAPAAVAAAPVAAPAPIAAAPRPTAASSANARAANEAIGRYQEAVRQFPRSAVYRVNLGRALREAGRTDEALTELRMAVQLEPQRAEHRRELGATLRAAGKLDEAAAELVEGVRLDDRNAGVLAEYAAVLSAQSNHAQAADRLRRAVRLQPDSARFHRELGRALSSAGNNNDAVLELREAVRLASANTGYHRDLAEVLIAGGRRDEAIVELREAARIKPDEAATQAALSSALMEMGMSSDALAAMREAARLEPRSARYHHDLGMMFGAQGQPAESLTELREAARLEPASAGFHFDLGQALLRAGQAQDATAQMRDAVRLDSARAGYHSALANALKAAGVPQEALLSYRAAIRLEPANARYHADLGIFLRDLGELPDALTELQQAVQLDGSQREYREALNEVRRRMR